MKNDNLTYDWLDFVALQKSHKKGLIREEEAAQQPQQQPEELKITPVSNELKSNPRSGNKIMGIVIHHTATNNPKATVSTLIQRGYSTNYEVDQQGNIYEYLDPDKLIAIASNTANRNTVAIDVTTGDGSWPQAQKDALSRLVKSLAAKYGFSISVAPDKGPMDWSKWQGKYTVFRHRNFHATACPSNVPLEAIFSALTEENKKIQRLREGIIKVENDLVREPRLDKIEGIVIHHTHTNDPKSTVSVLAKRGYSTNYEVDQQGNIYEYLDPDKYKALATGGGANEHTLAIDVTHVESDPFPPAQIKALKKLVNDLAKKYGFELKLAPDQTRMNWKDWKGAGGNYTLFRHRNFANTGCPMNLPMEELITKDKIPSTLTKAYDFIKHLGSSAYNKISSLISESLDQKIFNINDESKDKIYTKYQKYFDSLLKYLEKELKLTKPVKINLLNDEKNAGKVLGKTGSYINHKNEIVVYTTGRHVKDVMRSLAHELVHHRQNIRGEFENHEPTKHGYAQSNKHLRKMEKEAYLKGNLHFRDWEDNYKYRRGR